MYTVHTWTKLVLAHPYHLCGCCQSWSGYFNIKHSVAQWHATIFVGAAIPEADTSMPNILMLSDMQPFLWVLPFLKRIFQCQAFCCSVTRNHFCRCCRSWTKYFDFVLAIQRPAILFHLALRGTIGMSPTKTHLEKYSCTLPFHDWSRHSYSTFSDLSALYNGL